MNGNGGTYLVRYDPALSFTNSLSYAFFDQTGLASGANHSQTGLFDGRYIYTSGAVTVYDTAAPFVDSSSYQPQLNSLVTATIPATDGRYIYFSGSSATASLLRIPGYQGPPVNTPAIGYSTGLTVSGNINFLMPTATTATAGTSGASPSTASGFSQVFINGNLQYIPFY